ncbi:response regulator transcription factor [Cutibacterium acnes]|uniref:DNA-binding response regulator n=1 Tax=Cutibacterium acnes TaxID=1747 RepID=A0AA44ZFA2_CUTAC|nr:response regulator transcription factor [Cutibacterium acnes]OFL45083.1 DNA-binding response regulator [Propionibacterium sp. HMSC068C01]EFT09626.1 response regulator receiver domain protein [Cutibacterium acnes HL082PA2]EFT66256.1 response regulator receiver domain protein [Cutibacterium acnes HL060PA1]EGE70831.1 response regulator receiver domain protein [Cutibacterium acnes HL103PA1]MBU5174659.1 response regulator transcription factor [Cutibacterium acnes]
MRILIADDDPQFLRALRITLGARGYEVLLARDGQHALEMAIDHKPDIILLDLGMPRLDGVKVIEAVRGWSSAPILVISGRSGSAEKVEALDAGADDYVTKPFSMDELLARIRVLTRRIGQDEVDEEPIVAFGSVWVDLAAHTVTRDGANVRLTPTEWRVLELLIRNEGRLVTRQTMLSQVWGSEHVADTGYLRLYISQLRKKLEPEPSRPRYLITDAGMGYRLVLDP